MAHTRYERNSDGFAVFFPFPLLDVFKATFKSAKWVPNGKYWQLGPQSEDRIRQFVDTANTLVTSLPELDAVQLQAAELDKLQQELAAVNQTIARQVEKITAEIAATQNAQSLRTELASRNQLLQTITKKVDLRVQGRQAEQRALQAEQRATDELLSSLIDIGQLKGPILASFKKYHAAVGRVAHENFDLAQKEFIKARNTLAHHGIRLEALNWLASASFNRPDRDGASLMPPNHWYAIEHLPQDNDADDEGPANDGSAPAP